MRKTYRLLSFLSLTMLLFACTQQASVEVPGDFVEGDAKSITFDQPGGTKSITITYSTAEWTIDNASHDKWVKAAKEGDKLMVTAEPNDASDERATLVTVKLAGGGMRSFTIRQYGSAPVLRLEGDKHDLYFEKEATTKVLNVETNGADWTVEKLESSDWLTWEKDVQNNTLTLHLTALNKEDEGGRTNRVSTLYLSNANKHVEVRVFQNGWVQFIDPIYEMPNTREKILAAELKRGHQRAFEYEDRFWPIGKREDKIFMVFSTSAEQTPHIIYRFDWDTMNVFERAFLKAREGETFNMEQLDHWMKYNKFKKARKDPQDDKHLKYYRETEDRTSLYHVWNRVEHSIPINGYDAPGAYMEYKDESNYIHINDNGDMDCFPVRNNARLHDPSFKWEQVIEYEKSHGMVPDFSHKETILSKDPALKYEQLAFVQEVPDNITKGKLKNVLYAFNFPTVSDAEGKPDPRRSRLPEHIGTVGIRLDVYNGYDYAYNKSGGYWGYNYYLKANAKSSLKNKGYDFVRSQDESGWNTYVRGDEDLMDIMPDDDDNSFRVMYYRSKELVNFVK